ncbi:putative GST-like protein YibF [Tsuneonella dongtanensis]|uniref:Putative GST-like protein YibF n=1 Tax=Tsuneonella dongtanensis TaxID=692370 RepID=A0A1B2ACU2_9SPHN|nr:glutathione S-transferase family protein [Tsuneonella dongtanensis]ANY19966.1 putative GST-like protein YibF [Tsuneonella dongtanensis]
MSDLVLYGHPFSSYTWKALMPLYANGTPFEFRNVDPAFPGNWDFCRKVHPAGKFPVLVDGEAIVIESTAIIEHLAAHYPGAAPLIPEDPGQAVVARMMDRVFDRYVMDVGQLVVNAYIADAANPNPDQVAAGKNGLLHSYAWLENWLAENELPAHVSLASCAAMPSLFYADWIERIPDTCPRVRDLRAELIALPPAARCIEDARPYRHYFPLGAPDRD